jgi:hypothetical protein
MRSDGCFDIIDDLCAEISPKVKAGSMPLMIVLQAKEKSGFRRLYIRDFFNRDSNPQAHRLIELARQQAQRTRQLSGRPVDLTDAHRWARCAPIARVKGSTEPSCLRVESGRSQVESAPGS